MNGDGQTYYCGYRRIEFIPFLVHFLGIVSTNCPIADSFIPVEWRGRDHSGPGTMNRPNDAILTDIPVVSCDKITVPTCRRGAQFPARQFCFPSAAFYFCHGDEGFMRDIADFF